MPTIVSIASVVINIITIIVITTYIVREYIQNKRYNDETEQERQYLKLYTEWKEQQQNIKSEDNTYIVRDLNNSIPEQSFKTPNMTN